MAGDGEEETEYESDPEEVKMSLKMRRREASDDEEEEEEIEEKGGVDGEERREMTSARASDAESDGQGGAADYDDDELEEEEEYYDEYEEEEEEVELVAEYGENGVEVGSRAGGQSEAAEAVEGGEEVGDSIEGHGHDGEEQPEGEGEKKENEPFMVPTAGAFYMHDDRFRENMGGRNRRTFGGRKLWESKDDKKWGHDKFEEMNMRERPYDEGRKPSRGRSRGRGRVRGADRAYVRGNRPRSYVENNNNVAPKTVRGRGPRRYQALTKVNNEGPLPQNKQSQKPLEKASYASSRRVDASATNMESGPMLAKRVASNLNVASPPFYPSGTSRKDNAMHQKRDDQNANGNRNIRPPMQESLRGKNVADSVGMEKLHIDDPSLARPMGNAHSSFSTNAPQSKGQGRAIPSSGSHSFQASHSQNQTSRTSAAQTHPGQRNHIQGRRQASFSVSVQQMGQQPARASQSSSPPQSKLSITSLDSGDADLPESSKSKTALVGKGKGSTQVSGHGSFLYSGIQFMGSGGAMGAGHGDQNFPSTPAFLPVMQFGAQHPGGMPAVGMAFPGYVGPAQAAQLGMGTSDMPWLPYCPQYVAVDGSYHARPTGQTPALPASSKDNINKPNNDGKSQQKSDAVNDEFNQRQKARRYSEMNFGQ